ncbi:XrtB/PEP-CTERM-associated transcriptional regulator EpsA [Methylophilus aquaticus]|uniref:LuxR C-terminal-related transcriptional regulator n=1 Tax=Methylophilus aquaticus TaxID=1971610 RepID=A0ABT9JUD6_9PROT|nr:XrtB/PEP-CTERM-associated transcriptional regulator EpsA [Methylophilus aquaticus]MDP8568198.1 LuxR C-terminal-related transcriptional regulator [Methylophilus aquaticus]
MTTILSTPQDQIDPWELTLSEEQRLVFMEVIEESLRLHHRSHFFNWLQRGFQYLLAHEVVIVGVRGVERASYDYEYLTSSRYFADAQFDAVLHEEHGVVSQAFQKWTRLGVPVFCNNQVPELDKTNFSVTHADEGLLQASELKSFVVHGFGDEHSRIATLVMFGRLNSPANALTAHLLELLMPHLHCAIVKVTANKCPSVLATTARNGRVKPLSKRELEVLEWLQAGKTNWEIGNIMQVSPLTIKNHVQNILRKLDVENRSQAASKALKLGLITRKQ